jgi:hypothetical protein
MSSPVVMFLSTGRCGTQWLTATFRKLHHEVRCEHEPIGPLYAPRRHFRRYGEPQRVLDEPAVAEHLAGIQAETRPYVETGWPLIPALPHLATAIPERLRVVHLTRHPVPAALSHLAHNSYAGSPRDDTFTRLATLGPSDPRVFQPRYTSRWETLTPYEKCLFWWTEVNLFGLEFARRFPDIPLLRIQSEALLSPTSELLPRMLAFVGIAFDERWTQALGTPVDRWRHHTDQDVDPALVRHHPRTVETAARLGYEALKFDRAALRARYVGNPDLGLDRIGRYESDDHSALSKPPTADDR